MTKVVFITGGSSGIGKAVGVFLLQKGYSVYGTSRNPNKYQSEVPFPLFEMDVLNKSSIQTAVQQLLAKEGRIDVLINNAGVGITGPLEETPFEEVVKAYHVNVFGPLEVCKAVIPTMRSQHSGMIINITSIAGYMGLPYRGIYSATKGSLEILTEAYRMELEPFGIIMTNVAPGDFATNIAAGRYHAPVLDDSPYKKVYSDTLTMMNEHVDKGADPLEMAKAIYGIIESKHPKVHYRIGSPLQRFSIYLKKWLPDRWYEKMLKNHYKIK